MWHDQQEFRCALSTFRAALAKYIQIYTAWLSLAKISKAAVRIPWQPCMSLKLHRAALNMDWPKIWDFPLLYVMFAFSRRTREWGLFTAVSYSFWKDSAYREHVLQPDYNLHIITCPLEKIGPSSGPLQPAAPSDGLWKRCFTPRCAVTADHSLTRPSSADEICTKWWLIQKTEMQNTNYLKPPTRASGDNGWGFTTVCLIESCFTFRSSV